jgi:transcriptional regulator with XRE-family HTH domain
MRVVRPLDTGGVGYFTGSTIGVFVGEEAYPTCGANFDDIDFLLRIVTTARAGPENRRWAHWARKSKELLTNTVIENARGALASGALRVERLAAIQAGLGVSMQVLAEMLGVSRPALYKWLDATKLIALQEASRSRLSKIERLSMDWRAISKVPLAAVVHEPLGTGANLYSLLTATTIDEASIESAFEELSDRLRARTKSPSQRLKEAGFTRRPMRRSISDDE